MTPSHGSGEPGPCGWLKDKFGLSWQITPEMPYDDDLERSGRALAAILKMKKIDLATVMRAFEGK